MAYGARLESELGESPQGFKSPILRHKKRTPFWVFFSYGEVSGFGRSLRQQATVPLSSAFWIWERIA